MINKLNISYFNEMVAGIKALKADLVCVYGDFLIGTDNTNTNLKIYKMNNPVPLSPVVIITKELSSKFFSNITDTELIFDFDKCKIYCDNNKSFIDDCNIMLDIKNTANFVHRFDNLHTLLSVSYNVIQYGDITEDPNFQEYKTLKASDGAKIYYPNGNKEHGMYLYSNAIPLNKSDKVELNVCEHGDTFIGNFIVYKKKLNPINVYFRFIKLNKMW